MARATDVLTIARAQVGYREYPANSNKTKYGVWYGLDGQPWCMMFVQWCFAQAKAAALLPLKTASCGALMRAAQNAGVWVVGNYRPGDVVIYDFPGGAATDHCGIVDTVAANTIVAIEGNTGAGNDANGGQVKRRERSKTLIVGAVRPKYDTEEDHDMIDVEALTDAQLLRLAERMQAALAKRPVGAVLASELEEAKALGITDGSNPNAFCTRAQAAVIAKRAANK